MSSSIYTVSPASLHDHRGSPRDRMNVPHHSPPQNTFYHQSLNPVDSQQLLSPHSSHLQSNSASPTGASNTPAESTTTSTTYQPSDFSEPDDPFFGADFNDIEGSAPAFLGPQIAHLGGTGNPELATYTSSLPFATQVADFGTKPAEHQSQPNIASSWAENQYSQTTFGQFNSEEPPPRDSTSFDHSSSAPQLTPDSNSGGWSSDDNHDSLAPRHANMAGQSPRVTVSLWGKDGQPPVHAIERTFEPEVPGSDPAHQLGSMDDNLSNVTLHGSSSNVSHEAQGCWIPDHSTRRLGLAPEARSQDRTTSINQLAATRNIEERNVDVAAWVSDATEKTTGFPISDPETSSTPVQSNVMDDNIPSTEVPLGDTTENRHQPGRTYYQTDGSGGQITQADLDIMRQGRNWSDAPVVHPISHNASAKLQPESSQAAIQRFEEMCHDNGSIVSRAATWGREEEAYQALGNSTSRRPSILQRIVSKSSASNLLKRRNSSTTDDATSDEANQGERRESKDSLAPPSRATSWTKQRAIPSINTTLVGMAQSAASIGTAHAGSGSINAATPVTSPKSPFGFPATVRNTIRRPRSKTEMPQRGNLDSTPNIVGLLKKQGGPPVARLAGSQSTLDVDDEDEDEDDALDDSDIKVEPGEVEDIVPTFEGFQQHILRLNPGLDKTNDYLVERIAHQMIVRYKNLQNLKIKHLKAANTGSCMCGSLCMAQGGSAAPLDSRGDARGVDPLSARSDSPDGEATPLENGINAESFPSGIPIPPTSSLPAELECQLCYTHRKFQKPSDWTKHVHEDVQPFTCTWAPCRDPKMFKRKADWVRHENEGHRHLEWWTCDVEDCHHVCYRRDNFLQHLVREHKFTEPKVKTKTAIKRSGGNDPTWQKVERCHQETRSRPQDEPCRFCGKTFPTWKKLTVHLAKHMEHISLPVLRLVENGDLKEDTIISPVQDLPPRNFNLLPVSKQGPQQFSPSRPHAVSNPSPVEFQQMNNNMYTYSDMSRATLDTSYYNQPTVSAQYSAPITQSHGLAMPQTAGGFVQQEQYHPMPVSTAPPYGQPVTTFMGGQNQLEAFPAFNALGMPDPMGNQVSYDTSTDPTMQDHYSNPGSVSPYTHSPHQGHSSFYSS
ncbi:hypothetical protein PG997_003209 [Apiospora hydei]|uniref:C2H2-type domain-containing protein n=1 Tax=Apiospora hydei TaxID=1337664 RepID=A0ABR1WYP6_9PEZI